MLIVAMMDKWSDDISCCVVRDVRLYSVLDTVVISSEKCVVVWCLALWLVYLCIVL